MEFIADTVFLIDLWRESRSPGKAFKFAAQHQDKQIGIPWVVAGEFLAGARTAGQDENAVQNFLSHYPLIQSSPVIIQQYAVIYARLKSQSQLIGPNDLWIAAVCRAYDLPLVTRNQHEFERVEKLRVVVY